MDEARGEEATQSDPQQECILSGGVYLRHRPRKVNLSKKSACSTFPIQVLRIKQPRGHEFWRAAFGRAGVQETVPLTDSPF